MTTNEDKLIQSTWGRTHEARRARNIEVGVGALQGALFHADTIFNRDNSPAFDALGVGNDAIYRLVQVWPSESNEYIRSGWTLRRPATRTVSRWWLRMRWLSRIDVTGF